MNKSIISLFVHNRNSEFKLPVDLTLKRSVFPYEKMITTGLQACPFVRVFTKQVTDEILSKR